MAAVVVGLDVGGTKILGRAVSTAAPTAVLAEERVQTPLGPAALLEALAGVVRDLQVRLDEAGHEPAVAVGMGVPALVDRDGVIRFATHLAGVTDLAVGRELSSELALPVVVDNDANCAALAEARVGAGAGSDDVAVVTLGTGIGAGFIVGGRLLRGARGFAGEPGHMQVADDGLPCPCGRRGCWERYASGGGLAHLARRAVREGRAPGLEALPGAPEGIRGEAVVALARQGDPDASAVLDELARWVAVGLADLVDLLDPELVVVGGGLVDAGDLLLEPVRRHYAPMVLGHGHREVPAVEPARLGSGAGAIGAALLAGELVT
ncbi:ROK family protein [Rhabdothermincola salaria]|uniref:ROK family protein n=1 Tax=Rhabdothermincola salaria TaxID=2903142 RepID=UPI001E2C17D4|nr:ROK family protein [Rhabdothermincola salaria]MCD9622445.1 ROK family protein [Rhabdothermincola salaria]